VAAEERETAPQTRAPAGGPGTGGATASITELELSLAEATARV